MTPTKKREAYTNIRRCSTGFIEFLTVTIEDECIETRLPNKSTCLFGPDGEPGIFRQGRTGQRQATLV
jgi:hypothetical protein